MRESRLPSERESRIEWWRRLIFRQQSTLGKRTVEPYPGAGGHATARLRQDG
jgi:hypothetical protein